jgi:hypothetical protein
MAGRSIKGAILVALAAAATCVPVAWAEGNANTRVTIDSAFVLPGETQWAGDIFSPRKVCKNDRRVLVFRVRSGQDEKIGSTRSYKGTAQPGYYWVLSESGLAPAGSYYSKVKPTDRCQGDRSAAIPLDR